MQVGPYRVEMEVARGGMGVLYKARDAEGRSVALKLLLAEGGATSKRFVRETEALAKVSHPHVARFYGAGEHDGQPYLAMEFVEGRSLEERLAREGPLPLDEVLRIGLALCDALAAAHASGLLHRDVKPANVLQGVAGRVVLTDFGLVHDEEGQETRLTRSGGFLGTPGYWPPEQARGRLDDMGPASDVYALGATLYALLCGRPPRGGESLLDAVHNVTEPVEPLAGQRPGTPAPLEAMILACLEPDPRHRPTLAALRKALLDAQAPPPAPAQPKPPILIAAVLLALALALALALGLWLAWHAAPDPVAVDPPPTAPDEDGAPDEPPGTDAPDGPRLDGSPRTADPPPPTPFPVTTAPLEVFRALPAPGGHMSMLSELSYDAESGQVVSASVAGELRVWDMASGNQLAGWYEPEWKHVSGVAFGGGGHVFAVTGAGLLIRVSPEGKLSTRGAGGPCRDLDSDGQGRLVTCGVEGVRLWTLKQALSDDDPPPLVAAGVYSVARFHPQGGGLAVGSDDAWRWSADGRGEAAELGNRGLEISDLAFSPDGGYVAALASRESRALLYRWPSLELLSERVVYSRKPDDPSTFFARSLCFSADGEQLLTVGCEQVLRGWSVPELNPVPAADLDLGNRSWLERIRRGPGATLLSGGNDCVLRAHGARQRSPLWDSPLLPRRRARRARRTMAWCGESLLALSTRERLVLYDTSTQRVHRSHDPVFKDWMRITANEERVFGVRRGKVFTSRIKRAEDRIGLKRPQVYSMEFPVSDVLLAGDHLFVAGADAQGAHVGVLSYPGMQVVRSLRGLRLGGDAPWLGQPLPGLDRAWLVGDTGVCQLSAAKGRLLEASLSGRALYVGQFDRERVLIVAPRGSWLLGEDLRGELPPLRELHLLGGLGLINYGDRLELYDFEAREVRRSFPGPPGELLLRVLPAPDGKTCYVWTLRGAILRYRLAD